MADSPAVFTAARQKEYDFLEGNQDIAVRLPISAAMPAIEFLVTIAEDSSQDALVSHVAAGLAAELVGKIADAESDQYWSGRA